MDILDEISERISTDEDDKTLLLIPKLREAIRNLEIDELVLDSLRDQLTKADEKLCLRRCPFRK